MPSIMGTSLVLHIALYWLCAVTGTVASGEAILGQQESSATAAQLVGVLNAVTAAGSNATSLSTAIIDALASDAASVNEGLGDVPAFAQLVAQQMSKAQVPQDVQIAALGRAIATVLVNCSHASSCNTGSSTRFAGITQAAIIVDIAVAAGLRNHFRDIFAEAKRDGVPVAELTNSISFGLVGQENVAAAVSAIIAVFGATAQALDQAGNASQVAQLLLASAEATVARGEPSVFGSDNIANRTNDISGAVALAATVNQSRLARSQVDDGLSAAIAQGLVESSEAAAVLIASAMMVDNSTATAVAAAGITQALATNRTTITSGTSRLCQALFASEDLGPTYGNVTQGALATSSLGSQGAADLRSSAACRRHPGVVG